MNKLSGIGFLIIFIIGVLLSSMGYGFKTWQFYAMIILITIYGLTRFALGRKNEQN